MALAAWLILMLPVLIVMRRRRRKLQPSSVAARAAVAACFTTLGFYLVFQQIFRVALPGGIVAW